MMPRFSFQLIARLLALGPVIAGAACGLRDVWKYEKINLRRELGYWPCYGRDPGGSRNSPAAQIDRSTAKLLEVA